MLRVALFALRVQCLLAPHASREAFSKLRPMSVLTSFPASPLVIRELLIHDCCIAEPVTADQLGILEVQLVILRETVISRTRLLLSTLHQH